MLRAVGSGKSGEGHVGLIAEAASFAAKLVLAEAVLAGGAFVVGVVVQPGCKNSNTVISRIWRFIGWSLLGLERVRGRDAYITLKRRDAINLSTAVVWVRHSTVTRTNRC